MQLHQSPMQLSPAAKLRTTLKHLYPLNLCICMLKYIYNRQRGMGHIFTKSHKWPTTWKKAIWKQNMSLGTEKGTPWNVCPPKAHISLRTPAQPDQVVLGALWIVKVQMMILHKDTGDSDQTRWMRSLVYSSLGRHAKLYILLWSSSIILPTGVRTGGRSEVAEQYCQSVMKSEDKS